MRRIMFISALLIFLCVSSFGMAFDNHRRGFIIGGLGGVALNTWNELEYDIKVNNGTNIGLHADFRIGGGFKGDKLMLFFWSVGNWFKREVDGEKVDSLRLTVGVGMSYYFKPTSPSLYINAGIGSSNGRSITEGVNMGGNTEEGIGFMVGIGYEFAPHWSTEVGIMYSNPTYNQYETNVFAITLSIIGIAY